MKTFLNPTHHLKDEIAGLSCAKSPTGSLDMLEELLRVLESARGGYCTCPIGKTTELENQKSGAKLIGSGFSLGSRVFHKKA